MLTKQFELLYSPQSVREIGTVFVKLYDRSELTAEHLGPECICARQLYVIEELIENFTVAIKNDAVLSLERSPAPENHRFLVSI